MKFNHVLKASCAALVLASSGAAFGSPIYLDVGANFAPGADKVNATSTSVKNEVLYTYQSTTVITDLDGNGIDAGDSVSTSIGLFGTNTLSNNRATGFNPGEAFGSNADNGYGANWMLSFKGIDLSGAISAVSGGIPLLSYFGPNNLIEMLLTFDGVTFNNFMDLDVTSGGATGVSTVLFGNVDFTNVDAGYNNLLHAANGMNCAGATGFADLAGCGPTPFKIAFEASQETNVLISDFAFAGFDGDGHAMYRVSTNHDGSLTFNIPEPTTLFLMGSALLGLGFSSRRRA